MNAEKVIPKVVGAGVAASVLALSMSSPVIYVVGKGISTLALGVAGATGLASEKVVKNILKKK